MMWHLLQAKHKPEYVQKRCFASTGWEMEIRAICREHNILFQPYSILTANKRELRKPSMTSIAAVGSQFIRHA
jgi:diketogulonate reductase-like aldo/keto reductase